MKRLGTVEETAQYLIDNFEGKVTHYENDFKDGMAAYVYDAALDFGCWMDIIIDTKYNDLYSEWNQYIFCTTDFEDCVAQKFQEDDRMFDYCDSVATTFFINKGIIIDDEKKGYYWNKNPKLEKPRMSI